MILTPGVLWGTTNITHRGRMLGRSRRYWNRPEAVCEPGLAKERKGSPLVPVVVPVALRPPLPRRGVIRRIGKPVPMRKAQEARPTNRSTP